MRLEPFKAFLTKDRVAVVMVRGPWRQRVPSSDLPAWLAFYRRLHAGNAKGQPDPKKPGKSAAFYAEPVLVLENLLKQMEAK